MNTIKIIEQTLSKMSEYPTKSKLWKVLPKQIPYKTFKSILDHLEESNKIIYDKDGTILWIYADNPKLKRLAKTSRPLL